MGPQPRAKIQVDAQHQGRDIGRGSSQLLPVPREILLHFSVRFKALRMDAAEKHQGRPFTGSGPCVSSPLQVWQLRVDSFMIMIALYLPQLLEEGSGSEFKGTVVTSLTGIIIEVGSVLKLRERGYLPLLG